jgi:hypothetical protein
MRKLAGAGIALLCGACTYKAEVIESPAFNVVSSYGEQIPGKWLLYVEAAPLDRPVKPSGYACSAHNFPISAAGAFRSSVRETLDNVVDQLEVVDQPVTANQLGAYGARGLIVVRGEEIRPRLDVQPGFWTANMSTASDASRICECGTAALGVYLAQLSRGRALRMLKQAALAKAAPNRSQPQWARR